jgi:WD40 repeat protein
MRPHLLPLIALLVTLAAGAGPKPIPVEVPAGRKEPVSYSKEVADVLGAKCIGCHSDALAENKLNMEAVSGMLKGGKRGPAIVAGKADQSLLFQMSAHRVEPVMPPKDKKDAPPLTPAELGLLKLWIDSGAQDDSTENAEPTSPVTLGALPPGVQPIDAVDLTRDGERVAFGRANVVQVYDVASGLEIVTLGGHKDIVQSVRFSPDGRRLAAGGYEVVTLWTVPTGGLKATFSGHTEPAKAIVSGAALPGGILSGGLDKTVRAWDETGKLLHQMPVAAQVLSLAATAEPARVAIGSPDGLVRYFDASDPGKLKEIAVLKGHAGPVNGLALLPREKREPRVVSASADGTVRLWEVPAKPGDKTPEPSVLKDAAGPLRAVVVSPSQNVIAAAGDGGKVHVWDASTGKLLRTIEAHGSPILALAIDPAGERIATGSADKTARVIEVKSGKEVATLKAHAGPVNAVAFDPSGKTVVTAGAEGGVKAWDAATGQGVIAFGHTAPNTGAIQPLNAVAVTPTGLIVSASADKTLKGWRFEGRWSEQSPLGPHAGRVLALDFNPDGTLLAAGGGDPTRSGEIKVWEVGKGMHVRTIGGLHSDTVFGLRFSPDGTKLASAGADKFLKVSRADDGKEIRSFEGHTNHVLAVDWKSDGTQLVTGGADNVLKVWDLTSGEQLRTTQPAGKQVTSLRWLAGKSEVVGASGDKQIRFWNTSSGGVGRTLGGPTDYVFAVATSLDGQRVAAGGADGVLFLWDLKVNQNPRRVEPAAAAKTP